MMEPRVFTLEVEQQCQKVTPKISLSRLDDEVELPLKVIHEYKAENIDWDIFHILLHIRVGK